MEGFAGEGMVEVDDHRVGLHFKHEAVKAHAVGIDEGKHGAGIDGLGVELAVDGKRLLGEFQHVFLHVRTVGFVHGEGEVEFLSFGERAYFFFKSVERCAHAGDKLEGMFGRSLFHEFVNALRVVSVEFVCHGDILVGSLFHLFLYI